MFEHLLATVLLFGIAFVFLPFSVFWSGVFAFQLAWRHARRRREPWGATAREYLPASYAWAVVGTVLPAATLFMLGLGGLDSLAVAVSGVLLPFLVGAPLGWFARVTLVSDPLGPDSNQEKPR